MNIMASNLFVKVLGLGILLLTSAYATAGNYIEGRDYTKVEGIHEPHSPIVREFFSYNCPHCYREDTTIATMVSQLGKSVSFERTPVGVGRASWILSQQAYYVAQKLKMTRQVHDRIFVLIHEKGQPFTQVSQVQDFFVAQGAKPEEVSAALTSADAKFALTSYDTQAQLSGIRGVPSLLVNGHYLLSPGGKNATELAQLISYLVTLPE